MNKLKASLKSYYHLTKPGIIRGNAITAAAGFFLASAGSISFINLGVMLAGIVLVMASGCVFNNYMDRGIDKKMQRTKKRALVTGTISAQNALIFATVMGVLGTWLLAAFINLLTAGIGVFGLFAYVILYGVAKRKSVHGTAVGSISGAIPPVAGYVAVTNQLDIVAMLLFVILVCWQMPHFYAIAIFRMKEYASANIPVLPIKKGLYATKVQMILYILAFAAASCTLAALGYTGYSYLVVMAVLSIAWLRLALQGFETKDENKWARKVFGLSLIVLLAFSLMISVNNWLP